MFSCEEYTEYKEGKFLAVNEVIHINNFVARIAYLE
jgi:hypothetical protein